MAQDTKAPAPAAASAPAGLLNGAAHPPAPAPVNRKKQKRREKQAAKQAAEAQTQAPLPAKNGASPHGQSNAAPSHLPAGKSAPRYADPDPEDTAHYDEEGDGYSEGEEDADSEDDYDFIPSAQANGHHPAAYSGTLGGGQSTGKKSRRKKRGNSTAQQTSHHDHALASRNGPPHRGGYVNKDRIWNTSTHEERERIREFWLSLGEDERKSLVKIEKEAVLRKMKEQQKHSCSCTVCGRKRVAIEEELEVLYDAYYDELENYANHVQDGVPHYQLPPGSIPARLMHPPQDQYDDADELSQSEEEEEEDDDDNYANSEISSEEDYSSEERTSLPPPDADFLQFGSSLQVKGGILTVADDLLKNDGKKFIEMMEQLAERRMQREEEAQYQAPHSSMYGRAHANHNHPPPPPEEDEYDDEEDDEEGYEDGDYEEDEDDEDDAMTEEQRMEEGRRMFQIFAARMFEQRVLQAYREKVAKERQEKLLEELEEEEKKNQQREAKKAKEAQKRKEKKEQQKQAKAEEKARKEAEQAAKEAEIKAAEEKRLEEQRKKKEEQRKKKEAERKAQEEEKQRKEAEKLRRHQEQQERQQELERKQREQKAQEKKAKEEARRREREEREAKDKEARDKKSQEDKERKEREAKAKAEREALRKEEQPAVPNVKKAAQPAVALPSGLLKQPSAGVASPQVTPALPKAPTPSRPRQSSQQGSHGSSPKTPYVGLGTANSMSPASQIPNSIVPKSILTKPPTSQQPTPVQHAQPTASMPPIGPPPGMHGPMGMNLPPGLGGLGGYPHGASPMLPPGMGGPRPGMGHNMPMFAPQPQTQNFRGFPPPGVHAPNPMPLGRGFPHDGPPGFGGMPAFGGPNHPDFSMGIPSHSRQASGSFDKQNMDSPIGVPSSQPIQRPAPIQRPSSVKPHEDNVDDLASHLGSKALLDGAEVEPQPVEPRRTSLQPYPSLRGQPLGFGFPDNSMQPRSDSFPFGNSNNGGSLWDTPPMGFPVSGTPGWGNSPTSTAFSNPFPAMPGSRRLGEPREVWIRRLMCSACKSLAHRAGPDGSIDASEVYRHIDSQRPLTEAPITSEEIVGACEIIDAGSDILYYQDATPTQPPRIKLEASNHNTGFGEIGSPVPNHSVPASNGFRGTGPFPGLSRPF